MDEGKPALTDRVPDACRERVPNPPPRLGALTPEHLLTMNRGYPQCTRP